VARTLAGLIIVPLPVEQEAPKPHSVDDRVDDSVDDIVDDIVDDSVDDCVDDSVVVDPSP